jgi:hypothetical protein
MSKNDSCWDEKVIAPDTGKSLEVQLVLSLVIGISAFFLFCVRSSLARLRNTSRFLDYEVKL